MKKKFKSLEERKNCFCTCRKPGKIISLLDAVCTQNFYTECVYVLDTEEKK